MAGVKGRSGGARPNTGGARPGAGRKPKTPPPIAQVAEADMLRFLMDVAMGLIEANPIQVKAAIAAVQYTHAKKGEGGKKDERQDAAKKVAGGRFAPAAPPKLVSSR